MGDNLDKTEREWDAGSTLQQPGERARETCEQRSQVVIWNTALIGPTHVHPNVVMKVMFQLGPGVHGEELTMSLPPSTHI